MLNAYIGCKIYIVYLSFRQLLLNLQILNLNFPFAIFLLFFLLFLFSKHHLGLIACTNCFLLVLIRIQSFLHNLNFFLDKIFLFFHCFHTLLVLVLFCLLNNRLILLFVYFHMFDLIYFLLVLLCIFLHYMLQVIYLLFGSYTFLPYFLNYFSYQNY